MIKLCEQKYCIGCTACVNICPKSCIKMEQNEKGFLYPIIDQSVCISCSLCQKACPAISAVNKEERSFYQLVYAGATINNKALLESSSGGAFYELAKSILNDGGVVFGVIYDTHMKAVHIPIYTTEKLSLLQGTKYVQSDLGISFSLVKQNLAEGKKVLFTGTPCQISGLYGYLGGDNDNLITCDILCKGVPSPVLFEKYVKYLEQKYNKGIISINFRSKKFGWGYLTTILFNKGKKHIVKGIDDTFVRTVGFGLVRESCFSCEFTRESRISDITLGDFWHIGEKNPYKYDTANGVSVILINTKKGDTLFKKTLSNLQWDTRKMEEVIQGQSSSLSHPIKRPNNYDKFFADAICMPYKELALKHLLDKSIVATFRRNIPRKLDKSITKILKRIGKTNEQN